MSFLRHEEIYRSDGVRKLGPSRTNPTRPARRLDEFPADYSSAGYAPAEPASASPAGASVMSRIDRRIEAS